MYSASPGFITNNDCILADTENIYVGSVLSNNTLYQYVSSISIKNGELNYCKSFTDKPDTDISLGRSCFSNLFMLGNHIIGCGTKNRRPSNENDASIGIICIDKQTGNVIYNKAYTDDPASFYLASVSNACIQSSLLIIPIAKWHSIANSGEGRLGFLSIDVNTGNLDKCKTFNLLSAQRNIQGYIAVNGYIIFLSSQGDLIKFTPSSSSSTKYVKITNLISDLNMTRNNNLVTDGTYLYITTNNYWLYKLDLNFNLILAKKFPKYVYNIKIYENLLYLSSPNYIWILNKNTLLPEFLIHTTFSSGKFNITGDKFITTTVSNASKNFNIFVIPIEKLFDIFDIKIESFRFTRKNKNLYPVQDVSNITISTQSNLTLTDASVLQDTPYTISNVNVDVSHELF